MTEIFKGNFTQQEPLSEAAIEAAVQVMRSGRLHRYNLVDDDAGEVSKLEQAFADSLAVPFALAVASGGYAMGCAMRAVGVKAGDKVLTNAFTLAPVPGAIASLGAEPVFVEIKEDLTLCLEDFALKQKQTGAKVLLLSHMRGHLVDMEALCALCEALDVILIEDCAHTMGAAWKGKASGTFGAVGCFSTQTYKHINSGEGGLIACSDPELMAKMILLSGSYMLFERHTARPPAEAFEALKWEVPNISGRMDHLRAALLRPQLAQLSKQVARWKARYDCLERALLSAEGCAITRRPQEETYVGSSIQFRLPNVPAAQLPVFAQRCAARGVELKWFGADTPKGFTSQYSHWRYAAAQSLPQTDRILATLFDMRVPLTFSLEDCALIGRILIQEIERVA